MGTVSKLLVGVAGLSLLSTAPALATHRHGAPHVRHAGHSRVVVVPRRYVRAVGPATYVPLQPDEFVDPANPGYRHGVDDGSRYDSAADGIAVGREEPVPGPRNVGPILPTTNARGYEVEGPPIGASLPVVPELYDPGLY